ncbi:alpha-amylase family glycosyl hydrolase [Paenibacillus dendritiformis]|uniref:alpha-amylase family glycosyl hydrolase n=1 Tax=Paenibacillus dendritiformis TaxID=130049 RepID=UPI00248B845A|nr:alpha-amylase family glycosyl hydrolase [Paenibacillus dendritiformis]WGU93828.1 alpha-amylase family glycosyl hydrolase [Paenibacillus dendritiformis]
MRDNQLSITGEEVSIVMTMNRFMKKLFSMFLALALIVGYTAAYPLPADAAASGQSLGPVTSKDIIYQILTDRFYDGDPANNIPPGTPPELFNDDNGDGRGDGTDLNKYQGGDWKGIQEKIPYLKNMGITAVWISAPYENRENLIAGMYASYHGYHARNYFATNPHFGKMQDFTALVDALHDNGIKVVIDFVTNHSGPRPDGDGVLYEPDRDSNGQYVFDPDGNPVDYNGDGKVENQIADILNDTNGFFHHEGNRPDSDTSKFGYRHKELASLADYSQENSLVIEHLEKAGKFWKAKGIDGFRHDATLHMNPAFVKGFKDAIDSAPGGPATHFGEFFIGRPDPKYDEYRPFPDRTGVNNLDFEYYNANRQAFGDFSRSMSDFGQMLVQTSADYTVENQVVTFIDNHDVSRFRYIQPNDKPYHASLAVLLTSRGIPNLYYGTEQYLNPGHGGSDAGRLFLQTEAPAFSEQTVAYRLIGKLSALRQSNDALAYGTTDILFSNDDALVYKRQFFDKQVIVAVNRQPDRSISIPALTTTLPAGTYADALYGLLHGRTMTVLHQNGALQIPAFKLAGGEVSVWSHNPPADPAEPHIGDVISTMGRPGNTVYIYGTGLGGAAAVAFGSQQAAVVSAQDNRIAAMVPNVQAGEYAITVTKGGKTSNPFRYQVLGGDQVQVIFHVNKTTQPGQNVYVVGDIAELGGWDPDKALDSFMNPNYPDWFLPVSVPAGATFQFKFIIKDAAGHVTWEGGANRMFTATSNPTGTTDTPVYTWQP